MTKLLTNPEKEALSACESNYPDNGMQLSQGRPQEIWDEKRVARAMATLKEMHIQIRHLRTTIPRLIAPLTVQHPTPNILLDEFSKSIDATMQEIAEFQKLMTTEENRELLEHARKHRTENYGQIKPWKVTDDPEWFTREV